MFASSQVSYRFLALRCFPVNLVSEVVFFVCLEGWFFESVIKNIMPAYCKLNFVVKLQFNIRQCTKMCINLSNIAAYPQNLIENGEHCSECRKLYSFGRYEKFLKFNLY